MSERHTINPTEVTDRGPASSGPDRPHFPSLEQADERIPRLHTPGSWTISRDRWERIVTSIGIAATPEEIWRALTDPAALKMWFAACHGSLEQLDRDCVLDFEDGEFFFCRPILVEPPSYGDCRLQYLWRWLGIGQATSVTWRLEPAEGETRVTVTEEANNPPSDWRTWNGGGWPGILEQLADYLRTGTEWRWPWRRMGPYAQIELPASIYEAWNRLFSQSGIKYWLQTMRGSIEPKQSLTVLMGDASGMVEMTVHEVVEPGQSPPSFLPHVSFSLKRPAWNSEVGGRLWIEPAGWGSSIFQVFHYNWESLPSGLQLSERRILTSFWAGAMQRASQMCGPPPVPTGPHSWT
jgi:uncharacterized protein YndB with AHSA1/START domain